VDQSRSEASPWVAQRMRLAVLGERVGLAPSCERSSVLLPSSHPTLLAPTSREQRYYLQTVDYLIRRFRRLVSQIALGRDHGGIASASSRP
jgi:hypothetical protein